MQVKRKLFPRLMSVFMALVLVMGMIPFAALQANTAAGIMIGTPELDVGAYWLRENPAEQTA